MKAMILVGVHALCLLALAEPTPLEWPVDELEGWNGRSEQSVLAELGKPDEQSELKQPIPDIGEFQHVQERLKRDFPEYDGAVRRLKWRKGDDHFLVLLIVKQNKWVVFDALKWKDGVEF